MMSFIDFVNTPKKLKILNDKIKELNDNPALKEYIKNNLENKEYLKTLGCKIFPSKLDELALRVILNAEKQRNFSKSLRERKD